VECVPGEVCDAGAGGSLLQAKKTRSEASGAAAVEGSALEAGQQQWWWHRRRRAPPPTTTTTTTTESAALICLRDKCLNFLSPDFFTECAECAQEATQGARATPIGANSVAVGYVIDMLSIPLSGSYQKAWCGGKGNDQMEACTGRQDFPGPNVDSVMGWDRVDAALRLYPSKEWSGEYWRGNELGFIINNAYFWSGRGISPQSILLGARPSQHAQVRPFLEEMFTVVPGQGRYDEVAASIHDYVHGFLEDAKDRGIKVSSDIRVLTHQILNKVALGRDVTWEYAQAFVDVQSQVVALGTVSQIAPDLAYDLVFKSINTKIVAYVEEYDALLRQQFGGRLSPTACAPSVSCARQLASALYDTFYSAGGLSVPSTISTGLAVLFSTDAGNPSQGITVTSATARQFYWENIRYFPAVVGFPHWTRRPTCEGESRSTTDARQKPNGGSQACPLGSADSGTGFPKVNQYQGGDRVVPNLALAGFDPKKWGADADLFKIRPLAEYAKSLNFAEAAVDNSVAQGKMNRDCPGKELAIMIGEKFFQLFKKEDWVQPRSNIDFTKRPGAFTSDFQLSSKKMKEECREACPSCGLDLACHVYDSSRCHLDNTECQHNKWLRDLCAECSRMSWWDWRQALCHAPSSLGGCR